jgi:hypothetical protein
MLLEFELSALCLLGRHSASWAIPPILFALVAFEIGFCFLPGSAWTLIFLFYVFLHSWDDRYMPPYPAFSVEMGICVLFFCLSWLGTMILSVLASQVARITDVNYCTWLPLWVINMNTKLLWNRFSPLHHS